MTKTFLRPVNGDVVQLVDATSGNETVQLPAGFATQRRYSIRRADASANTVTVTVPTGGSIDGVTDGTTSIVARGEVMFTALDANAWLSSLPSTSGASIVDGSVATADLADGAVTAPKLSADALAAAVAAGTGTYAPIGVTNGIRLKFLPKAMAAAAAHQRGDVGATATRVKIASFGDSVGGLNMVHLYPLLLRALGGRAGTALSGQNAASAIGTPTGLTNGADTALWPVTVYTLAAGGSAQFGIGGAVTTCDTIKVYYFKNNGGHFKVQVDGVDEAEHLDVSTDGNGELGIITLSKTLGAHSVSLVHVSGGAVKFVLPAFEDSTASGIFPIDLSLAGMELSTWINSPTVRANLAAFLADQPPALLTFEMKESSTANLAAQVATLLDTIQAATPNTDILLMSSNPSQNTSQNDVVVALQGILAAEAKARGLPFFDQYRIFGSWAGINALGWGGDGVHRSTTCSEFLAGLLLSVYGIFDQTGIRSPFDVLADSVRVTTAIDVQGIGKTRVARLAPAGSDNDLAVTGNRWLKFLRSDGTTEEARLVFDGTTEGWLPRGIKFGSGNAGLYGTSAGVLSARDGGTFSNYALVQAKSFQRLVNSITTSSTTLALDFSTRGHQSVTLDRNVTAVTATGETNTGARVALTLIQDGTGSRTVSGWNAAFKFAGGTAPTLSTTAGARDHFEFEYSGGNWYEVNRVMDVR